MRLMKKSICCLLICLLIAAVCPFQAIAAGPIDLGQDCSLTIDFNHGGLELPYARFEIYRVADVDPYRKMTLTPTFAGYPVAISDDMDQSAWHDLATTLKGYVRYDALTPDKWNVTDLYGKLTFSGLKPGLFLVLGSKAVDATGTVCTPMPFLVFLPNENMELNVWEYDVTVTPKFTEEYDPGPGPGPGPGPDPDGKYTSRRVLKVWNDGGDESKRSEITVALLCDGAVYDTCTLSEANGWRCGWDELPTGHEWDVVESGAAEGYTVSVSQSGVSFVITNTLAENDDDDDGDHEDPTDPGDTELDDGDGDDNDLPQTGLLWWPVPLMLCLGLAFLVIGVLRRRSEKQ